MKNGTFVLLELRGRSRLILRLSKDDGGNGGVPQYVTGRAGGKAHDAASPRSRASAPCPPKAVAFAQGSCGTHPAEPWSIPVARRGVQLNAPLMASQSLLRPSSCGIHPAGSWSIPGRRRGVQLNAPMGQQRSASANED